MTDQKLEIEFELLKKDLEILYEKYLDLRIRNEELSEIIACKITNISNLKSRLNECREEQTNESNTRTS